MVPGNNSRSDKNLLSIKVEPYCKLPVDRDGFIGEIPDLKYLEPISPFLYIIQRKLYIHNAGHAILAYLGYMIGKNYIWEAVAAEDLHTIVFFTLKQVAHALSLEHQVNIKEILNHIEDLLQRFANQALGDTTERVGWDPRRKLGPEDGIIGAYKLLRKYELRYCHFPFGISCWFTF